MGTGSREEEHKANSLLDAGKIQSYLQDNRTIKTLEEKNFRFRKKLVALLENEQEPK